MFGATAVGLVAGRSLSRHADALREPFGVVQGALLTLVGLVLAFGLAMAVGRYDARRAAVVDDANAIGTAYLRAQTLREPVRARSLPLYVQYTDASLRLSRSVPGSLDAKRAIAAESALQRRLWSLAGNALDAQPTQSAPRLYVESLNEMIDMQTTRVSALNNRVPSEILMVEVIGAATALGLMALYLAAAFPRSRHDTARRRPHHAASLRHFRPRPTRTRVHRGPGRTTRRAPCLDGPSPGGAAHPLGSPA